MLVLGLGVRQMTDERLLTVKQVAEILTVHPETVRLWIRQGKLRGFAIGGTKSGLRISESDLAGFIRERRGAGSPLPQSAE